ncbi:iron ABC transporter permease [Clostridium aestuarii]|uniref:Iron ABC transporter permease n=1 Tax=Clostridium aestuarii TaxID=338193 RepID=A0ABT4D3L1_9CLOT|nr:iron ABC transporter permease [Clostridium aestuarii]MCY6485835.1 iron ABC transporter permease [Clostridium aestuarii]
MAEKKLKEKTGLKFDLKNVLKEPPLLISLLILTLMFIVFTIYPFAKVLSIPDKAEWIRVFTEKEFLSYFGNTMFSSLLSTTSAIIIGFIYAYAMNYTDIPGKKFFRVIALVPIMAPSVITGLAFIMLFGRRGFITFHLLHLRVDLYGWIGLWIVQTIAFFPLAYMTISGVLKSISPNLELAAQNLGARGFTLFRTVTLKLATPGVLSAFLLVAINSFADFGNPKLVAGNYRVLATEAYAQVTGNWDMGVAAVLSVMLVIPTLVVFLLQKYHLDRKSFVTVTGKPVAGLKRDAVSPIVKWILFAICSIMAFIIILIFAVIIGYAVTKNFGINNNFTLYNIKQGILNSDSIKNSWILAIVTAVITTVLGLVIAFVVSRKKFPGKGVMDFLAMLPVSLPGTFIGLALILAFNKPPLSLTGTGAIIVIGMCLRQLPVGYRNAISGFKQIDKSIEEASTNLGANSIVTFRRVVIPMLKNAFSTSFVYNFMKSMNTLSTVIFLVSPQWLLASVEILNLSDHGFYGVASATALGMISTILFTFGIVKLILGNKINIFEL